MTGSAVAGSAVVRSARAVRRRGWSSVFLLVPSVLCFLFLLLPPVALAWRALGIPNALSYAGDRFFLDALRLTMVTSFVTVTTAILLGTPLAYLLARRRFPGRRLVELVVLLPVVLPPIIGGVALLMLFGRAGLLGHYLDAFGIQIPFTTLAVVLAQLFTSSPFYIRSVFLGFSNVAREIEEAARVDGCSPWQTFQHVTLRLALPSIVTGSMLCWAKAVSEFGATLLFAGNFQGRTQTLSLAIWTAMEIDLYEAVTMAALLLGLSVLVLLLSEWLSSGAVRTVGE
ncbi:Sulfate transport system permease protein CysW [bacterium HR26]|nr:Sulfate transport system permease protein CysW [bacterium HR26]